LTYEVQAGDALARIAERYGTFASDLAAGNCLEDPDVIVAGQTLRVPGAAHPQQPRYECIPYELLTPIDGTLAIDGSGPLTFNWIGPRTPRNLIRITRPDWPDWKFEVVIELRQNETIQLEDIPAAGTYEWRVYPLDENFVQTCPEGGPWRFTKAQKPTNTPSPTPFGS
jgi:LysM repeat protein